MRDLSLKQQNFDIFYSKMIFLMRASCLEPQNFDIFLSTIIFLMRASSLKRQNVNIFHYILLKSDFSNACSSLKQ